MILKVLEVIGLIAILCAPVAAGQTIYIHSVSSVETVVDTPWERYVVYDQGGGVLWVGTEREFNHARATATLRDDGFRPSIASYDGAATTYVQTETYRAAVGPVLLDGINPSIMFDVHAGDGGRPSIPKSSMYVGVLWLQQNSTETPKTFIVSERTHKVMKPIAPDDVSGGDHEVEFGVPNAELLQPCTLIFVFANRRPAAIHLRSLAYAHYRIALHADTAQARDDVKALLKLDPSLKASAHR